MTCTHWVLLLSNNPIQTIGTKLELFILKCQSCSFGRMVHGLKSGRFERDMLRWRKVETDERFLENGWLINQLKFASYQIFANYNIGELKTERKGFSISSDLGSVTAPSEKLFQIGANCSCEENLRSGESFPINPGITFVPPTPA